MENRFEKYSLCVKENGVMIGVNQEAVALCEEGLLKFSSLFHHHFGSINKDENLVSIHSGGWSENEALIREFEESFWWMRYFVAEFRGGHYYFQLEGEKEWDIIPKNK